MTKRFNVTRDGSFHIVVGRNETIENEVLSSQTNTLEYLREISVGFNIASFGAGEELQSIVFDGIDVPFTPANLVANANGMATGSFTIPPKVPAGAKTITFNGTGTSGSAVFVGQGNLTVQTLRQIRSITTTWIDPLAQTFVLERNTQLCGVDLWFTAKAENAAVRVQIREVQNGVPTRTVLAEALVNVDDIVVENGGHTRINFPILVQLLANTEYAIVVLCNDPVTALAIAEMGKFDRYVQKWVAVQAYMIGVLLSSSNASTWDAHQKEDLAFRLLEANFTSTSLQIGMGSVGVIDTTDLVILALDETPTADTQVEYELTLPDGNTLYMAQGQPARLDAPITGTVNVSAKLSGTNKAAPLLWPGAQLLVGTISQSDDYYTRSIPALGAIRASLIYDAFIPSGATIIPEIQLDDGAWQPMTAGAMVNQGDGVVEYSFAHALLDVTLVKVRITLTGTSVARPFVRNIKCMAIE